MTSLYMWILRNEAFQEQLWSKTFEFLKDYLSPETVKKYGPTTNCEVAIGSQATVTDTQEEDTKGNLETGNQEDVTTDITENQEP